MSDRRSSSSAAVSLLPLLALLGAGCPVQTAPATGDGGGASTAVGPDAGEPRDAAGDVGDDTGGDAAAGPGDAGFVDAQVADAVADGQLDGGTDADCGCMSPGSSDAATDGAGSIDSGEGATDGAMSADASGCSAVDGGRASTYIAVSVAADNGCGLHTDGSVACWGDNENGSLGNGGTTASNIPVPVSNLSAASAIACGVDPVCCAILSADGSVACWGSNQEGSLGNGTTSDSSIPVPVSNLTGATAIAAGYGGTTCAILSANRSTGGSVACWGSNEQGSLGNGTTSNSSVPVPVSNLSGATGIAVGQDFACASLSNGTVACWGINDSGNLGNGTTTDSPTPVPVSNLAGATSVATGLDFACALTNGTVACWGDNSSGQLGNGTTTSSSVPVAVSGLTGATAITAGEAFACALLSGGAVTCWGEASLGNETMTSSSTPVAVSNLTGATAISAGQGSACALLADGTIACWGGNGGAFGNGNTNGSQTPVPSGTSSESSGIAISSSGTPVTSVALFTDCNGDPATAQTFVITNTGNLTATWTAAVTTGFSVVSESATTLAPQQSGTVTLSTPPRSSPPQSFEIAAGQLTVTATFSAPACSPPGDPLPAAEVLQVQLSEMVDGCLVFIQNGPLGPYDFGSVALNSTSELTVKSPVIECRAAPTPSLTLGGGAGSAFHVISGPLPDGEYTIGFTPTTTGPQSAQLIFSPFDANAEVCDSASLTFTVTGTGVP